LVPGPNSFPDISSPWFRSSPLDSGRAPVREGPAPWRTYAGSLTPTECNGVNLILTGFWYPPSTRRLAPRACHREASSEKSLFGRKSLRLDTWPTRRGRFFSGRTCDGSPTTARWELSTSCGAQFITRHHRYRAP